MANQWLHYCPVLSDVNIHRQSRGSGSEALPLDWHREHWEGRVADTLGPMANSNIRIEVWMPAAGWNGRMEGVGNRGFAGDIPYVHAGPVLTAPRAVSSVVFGALP